MSLEIEMPRISFSCVRSALGITGLVPLLGACFDMAQVDVEGGTKPPPRLIDDFNDDSSNAERQPVDASFEPWRCHGRDGGPVQVVRCDAGQGLEGTGRVLAFDLFDTPDGKRDYQGAELWTHASVAVDFSSYERFGFSAALESDVVATPTHAAVQVRLYCGALAGALTADEVWLESKSLGVEPDVIWYTYAPRLSSFEQPPWQKEQWQDEGRSLLDEASCLSQVDSVGIYVQPDQPDGVRVTEKLSVDDIYAQ